ncbi:hypothetical protein LBMAG53_10330 [Planctomycetota bacterium]|nr:hypothetical protein LBMAG53_10330 [Planctomycetota bacterium]
MTIRLSPRLLALALALPMAGTAMSAESADNAKPKQQPPKATGQAKPAAGATPTTPAKTTPAATPADAKAEPETEFDLLVKKIQNDPATSEADVAKALQLAQDEGRPVAANIALKQWLARNSKASPAVLLAAADVAFLAGEYDVASTRYRAVVLAGGAGDRAAAVGDRAIALSLEQTGAEDEAYKFFAETVSKGLPRPGAGRWDLWFVETSIKRNDPVSAITFLTAALDGKRPEQERAFLWDAADLLLESVRGANRTQNNPTEIINALPGLIGKFAANPARQSRYGFYAACLAYFAQTPAKDGTRETSSVLAAARSYVKAASNAEAVRDIAQGLWGGGGVDGKRWNEDGDAKRALLAGAIDALPETERALLFSVWRVGRGSIIEALGQPADWLRTGAKDYRFYQSPVSGDPAIADIAAAAVQVGSATGALPAVVRALANGKDLAGAATWLVEKESWHLSPDFILPAIGTAQAALTKGGKGPDLNAALAKVDLAASPLGHLDPQLARTWVQAVLVADLPNAGTRIAGAQWWPYAKKERLSLFRDMAEQAKRSVEEAKRNKKPVDAAAQAAADSCERLASGDVDVAKAPNPTAKAYAEMLTAKDPAAITAAGKALAALVAGYDTKSIPAGKALTRVLVQHVLPDADPIDLHLSVLGDILAKAKAGSLTDAQSAALDDFLAARARSEWPSGSRGKDQEKVKSFNKLLQGVMTTQIAAGTGVDPTLFRRFLETRRGRDWSDAELGNEFMSEVLTKDALKPQAITFDPRVASSAVMGMWLVKREFPKLADKWPVERAFDAKISAETAERGWLDPAAIDLGRDEKKIVAAAAAKLVGSAAGTPRGHDRVRDGAKRSELLVAAGKYDPTNRAYTAEEWSAVIKLAMTAEPAARDAMISEAAKSAGKRFDELALGLSTLGQATSLKDSKVRAEWLAELKRLSDRLAGLPIRSGLPSLRVFDGVDGASLSADDLTLLVNLIDGRAPARWDGGRGPASVVKPLVDGLAAAKRTTDLFRISGQVWRIAADTGDRGLARYLADKAKEFLADGTAAGANLAMAYGNIGTQQNKKAGGDDGVQRDLVAVAAKAAARVTGASIGVAKTDPRYELFVAQAEYTGGRFESAWENYLTKKDLAAGAIDALQPEFILWLITRHTINTEFKDATNLAQRMEIWSEKQTDLEPELRARQRYVRALIAFHEKSYPLARAQFSALAEAQEFANTRTHIDAELMIADVERLTKNYDAANTLLLKLTRRPDKYTQAEAYYRTAQLRFDQNDNDGAKEAIKETITRDPNHQEAILLAGKLGLRTKDFETTTELELGGNEKRRIVQPGRPLRVRVKDSNLTLVGGSQSVEMRVWTDSGDEEDLILVPFADKRDHFTQKIDVVLAGTVKGDGTLQVLGGDKVHVAYSPKFLARNNVKDGGEPSTMEVITDAALLASSGTIKTQEELDAERKEAELKKALGVKDDSPTEGVALSQTRPSSQVRPGNVINLRVTDLDRSTTSGKDTVMVSVKAKSGDVIEQFPLTESKEFTGVFEGSVRTVPSPPVVFASDSAPGSDPNYITSPTDQPAWKGDPNATKIKTLTVDLNDNVPMGTLSVLTKEPGRKLKDVIVQTSFNGKDFSTVGRWPKQVKPWDGGLSVRVAAATAQSTGGGKGQVNLSAVNDWFAFGHQLAGVNTYDVTPKSATLSIRADELAPTQAKAGKEEPAVPGVAKGGTKAGEVVIHARACFTMTERATRVFRLITKEPLPTTASAVILVDGVGPRVAKLPKAGEAAEPPEIIARYGKGVHRVDVVITCAAGDKVDFDVEMTNDETAGVISPDVVSLAKNPEIAAAVKRDPVAFTETADGLDLAFGGQNARQVRMILADYSGDAPAITKLNLSDAKGTKILPTKEDFQSLRRNQQLELLPGDTIDIGYADRTLPVSTDGEKIYEAKMQATFANADISAAFVQYDKAKAEGAAAEPTYIAMRRFDPGDTVKVFIRDPDLDTTENKDSATYTVKSTTGQLVTLKALETDDHSGVFIGTIFTAAGTLPKDAQPGTIAVTTGDDITFTYRDIENTDMGIPWERTAVIQQTFFEKPILRVMPVASGPDATSTGPKAKQAGGKGGVSAAVAAGMEESWPADKLLTGEWVKKPDYTKPVSVVLGVPLVVEVTHPFIAKSSQSFVEIYAQTSSGREKLHPKAPAAGAAPAEGAPGAAAPADAAPGAAAPANKAAPAAGAVASKPAAAPAAAGATGKPGEAGKPAEGDAPFDTAVPGTIRLLARLGAAGAGGALPVGYTSFKAGSDPLALDAIEDGRFSIAIPTRLGPVPVKTFASPEYLANAPAKPDEDASFLAVHPQDTVYIAAKVTTKDGKEEWIQQAATFTGDAWFDATERRYSQPLEALYVGETVYLRTIDLMRDTGPEKDTVELVATTPTGTPIKLTLTETLAHSGIFKGLARITFAGESEGLPLNALPAMYGDTITFTYQPAAGAGQSTPPALTRQVLVHKGSDGSVLPFTKRFADPDIAVKTQFAVAEAYFELAKKHRGQAKDVVETQPEQSAKLANLVQREISQGKKLLDEVVRDYPDAEIRAQADYLRGNLELEYADGVGGIQTAKNQPPVDPAQLDEMKRKHYSAALKLFSDIVSGFSDSEFAPKAQFKKGLVYEKLGELDQSCEEYVKLSYRFPDHELVAETIARLGKYFLQKGKASEKAAEEVKDDKLKAEKLRMDARGTYSIGGEVFGRLKAKFPSHELAPKTMVLSGMCYMRAQDWDLAIAALDQVINDKTIEDKELIAEAMYWAGDTYLQVSKVGVKKNPLPGSKKSAIKPDEAAANAYRMFKNLTWNHPDGVWAKYARGRLAQDDTLIKAAMTEK